MKYTLVVKQAGEGCDYTIGCGMTVRNFEANDLDEALKKAKELLRENLCLLDPDTERDIDWTFIVPIEETIALPIDIWQDEILAQQNQEVEEVNKARELAELERLKAKYE